MRWLDASLPALLPEQSRLGQVAGPDLAGYASDARAGAGLPCVRRADLFVSDHVETLGEIDHEGRALATRLGISRFEMVAGLNDSPKFIETLAGIVLRSIRVSEGVEHTPASGQMLRLPLPAAERAGGIAATRDVVAGCSRHTEALSEAPYGSNCSIASREDPGSPATGDLEPQQKQCGAVARTLHGRT